MMLSTRPEMAPDWRERGTAVAVYLGASALGHLAWEIVQLPLYGLWRTASIGELHLPLPIAPPVTF